MRKTALVIAILALAGLASAQAGFITTTLTSNNGGSAGWVVMFDVKVINPSGLKITDLDVNTSTTGPITMDVYTAPTTYVGKETTPTAWTKVSTGQGTGKGTDVASPVDVADFVLQPGTYGFAVHYVLGSPRYTNGIAGSPPTGNMHFFNADIDLTLGASNSGLFNGASTFTPRVWNGTIYYAPAVTAVIAGTGAGTPGSTYNFSMISPTEPNLSYQVGTSLGKGPTPLDTRMLGLTPDPLLVASVGGTLPGVFKRYSGLLDASGRGTADLAILAIPQLKGIRIYTAFVTLKGSAPSGVATISNTFDFLIQ